jgi:hypothetical protein
MSCPTDSSSHDSERLLSIAVGELFSLRINNRTGDQWFHLKLFLS